MQNRCQRKQRAVVTAKNRLSKIAKMPRGSLGSVGVKAKVVAVSGQGGFKQGQNADY